MKVNILVSVSEKIAAGKSKTPTLKMFSKGDVADLPENVAKRWIDFGYAEGIKEKQA